MGKFCNSTQHRSMTLTRNLIIPVFVVLMSATCFAQRNAQPRSPQPQGNQQQSNENAPATNEPNAVGANTPGLAAPVDPKSYKIGANDVLAIRVWREPELSQAVVVRPDGMFTLPLIGDVKAGGLTPEELKTSLIESLGKFITKPEVTVSVQQVLSKKYYITGEVGRTGMFPLVVPTTVLEALSSAGGFREYANKKNIIIMRGNERLKFNYNDVIKGKKMEQNIHLQDGDHIIVQ
jgi:polysaccharide export outer membrane protein